MWKKKGGVQGGLTVMVSSIYLTNSTSLTLSIATDCWQTFKLKPNYQQIMAISLELEKAQEDTTVAQRGKAFKKLTDAQEGLVNKAARERVETFVFMAGSSVNEDSNLTFLFTSEGMEEVGRV